MLASENMDHVCFCKDLNMNSMSWLCIQQTSLFFCAAVVHLLEFFIVEYQSGGMAHHLQLMVHVCPLAGKTYSTGPNLYHPINTSTQHVFLTSPALP